MLEFATGVINVLEKKVFNAVDQERMLKAPDKKSAFLTLFDTDLGEIASGNETNIEKILEGGVIKLKEDLSRVLSGEREDLIWFLFLRFNLFSLKLALKKIATLEQNANDPEAGFFYEDFEKIENALLKYLAQIGKFDEAISPFSQLNPLIGKMAQLACDQFLQYKEQKKEIDSNLIEEMADTSYFQTKLFWASKFSKLLEEQVMLEIDFANLKALLQKKLSGKKNMENNNCCFIEGGNLKTEELRELVLGREGEIAQDLKKFLEILDLGFLMENFIKQKSTILLEKDLNSFLSRKVFEKERQTGSGIEKVLAYFQKKLNAISNIRLIMFAKENGLEVAEIENNLLPI